MSPHTVAKVHRILTKTGEAGVGCGVWTPAQNPAANIRVPGSSAGGENDVQLQLLHQDAIPTTDQVDALLEAAWADNARNGFILEMAARSGLRWSEIMGLKASDFDFTARTVYVQRARRVRHDGTVHVKMPKTKAGRRKTVLAKSSVNRVRAFVAAQNGEFLVTTKNGTVLQRSSFTRPMNRYRQLGYPHHLSVHSLRHFFATNALAVGVSVADVSHMCGHSSPQVTLSLYVHGSSESVDRATNLL